MNAKLIAALLESITTGVAILSSIVAVASTVPKVVAEWQKIKTKKKRISRFHRWDKYLAPNPKDSTTPWH